MTRIDPSRMGIPYLTVTAPPGVQVSGFNEKVLEPWKQPSVTDPSVHTTKDARGKKVDDAPFVPEPGSVKTITALDEAGQQVELRPEVKTSVRVHTLGTSGRHALLTVISHSNQGVGEAGTVKLDLPRLVGDPGGKVVIEWMARKVLPLRDTIRVDTRGAGCMALLEIADRAFAERALGE